MPSADGPTLVLDVETQHLAHEVGGWGRLERLRVSVAVTHNSLSGVYTVYTEDQMDALAEELARAQRVVGYNLLRFDYPVLQPYTQLPLGALPTVDMLDHLHRALGFRVPLDSVAQATLGLGKAGNGLDAVRWFREGKVDQVAEYCRQDVEITRKVYEFGQRRRYVAFIDKRSRLQQVPVGW
ncbi:MAG: hypothetical protein GX605_14475 [Chloroflexi bacterium]|nr:hypothetical protein [Chloroflexota bacterium]